MSRLYRYLLRLEAILAGIFLVTMVAMVLTGGVARMLHHPLNWTIDLATAFFAWAVFLSADIAWRTNTLMALDLVTVRLPARIQGFLNYINLGIIAVFLAYGVWYGITLAWASRARTFNGIPGVSYSWVTASIAVGCGLMLITTLLKIRDALREDGLVPASAR